MIDKRPLIALTVIVSMVGPAILSGQAAPDIYLYVNDFVGVLTYDEIDTLDNICYELDKLTSDEIAIVIVNTTQPESIDIYAVELFESAGIGKAGKDNGVLVLVSTDESLWRIEVGYGLEGILNDAKVGTIGRDNLEPYLQAGDCYAGVFYTVKSLASELTSDPGRLNQKGYDIQFLRIDYWQLAVAIVVFVGVLTKGRIFLWLGFVISRGKFGGGRSGGGGSKGRF